MTLQLNDVPIDADMVIKKVGPEFNNNNNDAEKDNENLSEYEDTVPYQESDDDDDDCVSLTDTQPSKSTETIESISSKSSVVSIDLAEGDSKVESTSSATSVVDDEGHDEKTGCSETVSAEEDEKVATVETAPTEDGEKTASNEVSKQENDAPTTTKVDEIGEKSDAVSPDTAVDTTTPTKSTEKPVKKTTVSHTKKKSSASDVQKAETKSDTATKAAASTSSAESESNVATPKKSPKRQKKRTKKSANGPNATDAQQDYSKFNAYNVSISPKQRRYYLETRARKVELPADECEIFVSNVPINVLEGELIPLFERYGKIWELRLLMAERNPHRNAGFAFVRFTTPKAATDAAEKLDKYEIVPGKHLAVRLSQPNLSLFVGNIHRGRTRDQVHEKLGRITNGLKNTFMKTSFYEETKNCGFCFLEYNSHADAFAAKRILRMQNVWGRQLFVDWAQRRQTLDDESLKESKTVFINNLPKDTAKETLEEMLKTFGTVERFTQIKDYAFALYTEHEEAAAAVNGLDKTKLGSDAIEISLAMPKPTKPKRFTPFNYHSQRHANNYPFNFR